MSLITLLSFFLLFFLFISICTPISIYYSVIKYLNCTILHRTAPPYLLPLTSRVDVRPSPPRSRVGTAQLLHAPASARLLPAAKVRRRHLPGPSPPRACVHPAPPLPSPASAQLRPSPRRRSSLSRGNRTTAVWWGHASEREPREATYFQLRLSKRAPVTGLGSSAKTGLGAPGDWSSAKGLFFQTAPSGKLHISGLGSSAKTGLGAVTAEKQLPELSQKVYQTPQRLYSIRSSECRNGRVS
jgi:hypothetical protein